MKRSLIAFLLSLACGCAIVGAVGCDGNEPSSSQSNDGSVSGSSSSDAEATLTVDFAEGEGYSFLSDTEDGATVRSGDVVSFSVKMSAFYTGYPVVSINGKAIAPDNDGIYNVEMSESIEVTVAGIRKEVSNMAGTGAFDDAFVVSRPVDLLYIAEQVNKGVYAYVTGAYVLANDIDCGGEELEIIGDLSTENSFFSGCFTCLTDPETGEMQRYTISNFVIDSDDANYVGLFGTVYADLSVTSSGLFYGIQLDNFTINASISKEAGEVLDNRSISAGGLIGYGVGANLYLCDATNGTINVYADDSYFSFAGGLIGYQQAFYMAEQGSYFPSEIVYSTADVDVRVLRGMGLYAGGISGYLATNYPFGATAFIHNSYSTGNVSGAQRSGGIAGGLGQYTSIGNCYATGNVSARTTQTLDDPLITDKQYCYSYAGGLVGFAENDTVVNDGFFTGTASAYAASAGCALEGIAVGGGYEQGYTSASARKFVVDNCIALSLSELSSTSYLTEKLGWGAYDWSFEANAYPAIYYGTPDGTVTASLELKYVALGANGAEEVKINDKSGATAEFFNTGTQSSNIYSPIGNYFLNGGLEAYLRADNGYLSYGYFFDENCTQKVPYSYVPQRSITLYIGFADPEPVLGTYQLVYGNSTAPITIKLDNYGFVTYTDGVTAQEAHFLFDGETLIVEGARLARYFDGEIVVDESSTDTSVIQDANFDMYRYAYYDFVGGVSDGVLTLYDGVYFTAAAPLTAKKELFRGEYYAADGTVYKFYGDKATAEKGASFAEYDGYVVTNETIVLGDITLNRADLKEFDEFRGVWTKSATVNKTYTFDGMGGWSYVYKAYVRNGYSYDEKTVSQKEGTYTVKDGVLTLDGTNITASFDSDGFLVIKGDGKDQIYYAESSYVGTWQANNLTIELFGINADGIGRATANYGDGSVYELVYERSETDGYVVLYFPHDDYVKDTVFGYFSYDTATNTLSSTVVDPNGTTSGYLQTSLFVIDDYNGEWICNAPEFLNVEFRFNGNGLYEFLYGYTGMEGTLTLVENGVETTVSYTLDSTLQGYFAYEGLRYTMTYDEDSKAVVIEAEGVKAELERKDVLAGMEFVDLDGVRYLFDGRSNLSTGGKLTVDNGREYAYFSSKNGWIVKDGENEVGTIALTDNYYALTIGGKTTALYVANEFMGEWAVGGAFGLFEIGPTDLDGVILATYLGHEVRLTYIDTGVLTFRYKEGNMPITYYVFVVNDPVLGYDVLVLSQYTNLYGDYSICTKANELYGSWTRNDGLFTLTFDGITGGAYSNGKAALSRGNGTPTDYYYAIREKGVMMWSQTVLGGRTLYYKIEMLNVETDDVTANDVYVKKNAEGKVIAALRRIEVDGLYLTEANDAVNADTVYFFDGLGTLYVGNEAAYTYKITSYNSDDTAYLEITDKTTGVTYFASLDYGDPDNVTLKLGDPIEENA